MKRYNQPLFLAVKMNRKVLSVDDTTTVDTYIVNEKNVKVFLTNFMKTAGFDIPEYKGCQGLCCPCRFRWHERVDEHV